MFPHMPFNIIMDDLRHTHSLEVTIENVLEGNIAVPSVRFYELSFRCLNLHLFEFDATGPFLFYKGLIQFHLICQMLAKFSGVESESNVFKFRKRKRKFCVLFIHSIKRAREIRSFIWQSCNHG